jgi:hypothetical protein
MPIATSIILRGTLSRKGSSLESIELKTLCWICKLHPANCREHINKRADLKLTFDEIDQQHPIIHHSTSKFDSSVSRKRIGSVDNDLLKFQKSICTCCNNDRTKPNDLEWSALSKTIRGRGSLTEGDVIDLRPFKMNDVQLYFVKLMGCAISQSGVPIDLTPLSDAIMRQTPYPFLGLYFYIAPTPKQAGFWPMLEETRCGFFYTMDNISIQVMMVTPGDKLFPDRNLWDPTINPDNVSVKAIP